MPLILTGASGSTTLDSSAGLTFSDSSNQAAAASPFGLKNRIINGDMVISQRFGTSSVTPTDGQYTVDRFFAGLTQASKFSVQQVTDAPTGFVNSLRATSLSAYSVGTSDTFLISQIIEGLNVADLGWGTASAQTVTLSFWVKSSLTGTFGGVLKNSAANRSYPFSYTISVANTWEKETITIPGDTSGTWLTTNGIGIYVIFGLGGGSTFSGTAGSWTAGNLSQVTGGTSVVGTNAATWQLTGVQLERNTTATPFEWLPYGTELALCQRYFQICAFSGVAYNTGEMGIASQFKVNMRTQPSMSTVLYNSDNYTGSSNTIVRVGVGNAGTGSASYNAPSSGNTIGNILCTGLTANNIYFGSFQASAEL
jgi:hypothetical protein